MIVVARRAPAVFARHRGSAWSAALAGVLLAGAIPARANAQDQEPPGRDVSLDARLRSECRLAAQVLETGRPAPKRAWALQVIPNCGGDAPAAVAALWRAVPADSATLELLVAASVLTLDARPLAAVAEVARDRGAPTAARLAALRALVSYAVPGVLFTSDEVQAVLRAPGTTTPLLTPVDHPNARLGTQPPAPGTAAAVRSLYAGLAREASPVGTLAATLHEALPHPDD